MKRGEEVKRWALSLVPDIEVSIEEIRERIR